ncbi:MULTISPECIES: flagellar biosynthesis protein FlhB [Xanthomonas]|uniref:Flagellar biosynthetic protein FlhB n=1 Tax=Xanthomonas cucurbitae TaxID=56453 RepID=A0A2S7DG01_9XANT|nr:flagellar biosynthesis protein FlhB [Xanthomonas cucurbitae]PPU72755.1 flagellar biosynthesis protein FlhB [Xanthomonas cucurbitae]QHG87001.1 flagellar biosynthesis protein FlhB [Xanthomonas cucurbitae]WDM69325.1 flagellar biosynthesis protein FlhB [Xanthomonas cucurbitae]WDM73198.1 flagellar biosynthesis protein FlhB [Xanthomonas cucurbitae]WDM76921.1 flagellar biosynthesis protein FlhB [Xanthomonas cucurbitae]
MSESEDGGERTELPTEKRLREAREQGNIPQSRELSTAAVFGAGVFGLMALASGIGDGAEAWMKNALTPDPAMRQNPMALFGHFGDLLLQLLWVMLPLIGICLLAGLVGPLLMSGLHFSGKAFMPDLNKLNPMNGVKRMWGSNSLAELVRSVLRLLFVALAAWLCFAGGLQGLRELVNQSLEQAVGNGLDFTKSLLLYTAGALVLLAAIDAPYQKWNWLRKLKMTREEIKREMKESEGSPEVKGRIRQMQMQMSQRQMMEAVPKADVVLMNPTHYAVALKYEGGKMRAPIVVAKGVDEMAFRIREAGEQHRVAIVTAPPLARALYREAQIGKEIPVRLYSVVAQVLSYVYQLRGWNGGPMPEVPSLDVDEFGKGASA